MAGYGARRTGINVSQYIADLNKEPSAFELDRSAEENFNLDDELAQFTNAEFLDFDSNNFLDNNATGPMDFSEGADADAGVGKPDSAQAGEKPHRMNFVKDNFPVNPLYELSSPTSPRTQFPGYAGPPISYPQPTPNGLPQVYAYHPAAPPPSGGPHHHPTDPNAAAAGGVRPPVDEGARAAAEEDKRRRNTAASARFRVKKKEREKALEQKTQELEKANRALEQRIGQLETENEWLRGLVVEKNGVAVGAGARRTTTSASQEKEKESDEADTKTSKSSEKVRQENEK